MTPKEKAKELISKFEPYVDYQSDDCFNEQEKMLINAKQCVIICVDEIIDIYKSKWNIENTYWQEVKQEIEKL